MRESSSAPLLAFRTFTHCIENESTSSYRAPFVTGDFIFGMCGRRSALDLFGMQGARLRCWETIYPTVGWPPCTNALPLVPNGLDDENSSDALRRTGSLARAAQAAHPRHRTPFIRCYAGAPLTLSSGHRVGALCIIHSKPDSLPVGETLHLKELAAAVSVELERHAAALRATRSF